MTGFRWSLAPQQPTLAAHVATAVSISPLLAQCLLNRGLDDPSMISVFLQPRLKKLSDPYLLPNMSVAVERLLLARERGERIVIFGDYDVDGVTSTTILMEVFSHLGIHADYYVPHRLDEGYGLTRCGVENCLNKFPASLLVAVDCGSTSVESISWLKSRGTDALILDHHQVSDPAPEPVALVNPQLSPDGSFQELCSAGLAFKLAHALIKRGRELDDAASLSFDLKPLLDLVALGTVADLVPLVGENRILVPAGMRRLETTERPGLVALKEVAEVTDKVGRYEIGFQLGPRLNASGRMETADASLRLLMAKDLDSARELANELDLQNRERQLVDRNIAQEVIGAVKAHFKPDRHYVIVEGQMFWHVGVVGIVASKVVREFYRPTIVMGGDTNEWRGSGRSIEGFNLAAALCECDDLLVRHGGHPMAAGLSIEQDRVDDFRERLNEIARRTIKPEDLKPRLRLDAEVQLDEISLPSIEEWKQLEPTGQGNEPIQLATRSIRLSQRPQRFGRTKKHVRMRVTNGRATHDAIWWNAADSPLPEGAFDLAFEPQINEFNSRRNVQLRLLDWRKSK